MKYLSRMMRDARFLPTLGVILFSGIGLGAMWRSHEATPHGTVALGLFAILFAVGLAILWLTVLIEARRRAHLDAAVTHADRIERQLEDAIESSPAALAIFDADDRLVVANHAYRDLVFPGAGEIVLTGSTFAEMVRSYEEGLGELATRVPDAEMVARAIQRHHASDGEFRVSAGSDRAFQVSSSRTAGGGRVTVIADLSELARRDADLRRGEERYRRLIEFLPDAVFVHQNGAIVLANPAAVALFGARGAEDLVGLNSLQLTHPDSRDLVRRRHRRSTEGDPTVSKTVQRRLRLDGSEFLAAVVSSRVEWEGRPAGLVVLRDVTAQMEAEAALRRSEETAKALINATNESSVMIAADGRILYINERFARRLGHPADRAVGQSLYSLMAESHTENFRPWHERALADGRPVYREYQWRRRWYRARYYPVGAPGTPADRLAIFTSDITSQKRAELDMQKAKEAAELASRSKSEFLANMSHELRTPLNAIIGFSEMIRNQVFGATGDPRYREYAADIHASGSHLLELINDILDLSKIEAGKLELYEEEVEIGPLVENCIRLIRGRVADRVLTITADVQAGMPALWADERKLKQIVLNLLSNAVKFTDDEGAVAVSVRADPDGDLDLVVADTGIGMSADDIEKALAPFGQVDSALNRKYQGTGLGLPLTKSLVELHGGRLLLDSAIGAGTTVTVRLPAARVMRPHIDGALAARAS